MSAAHRARSAATGAGGAVDWLLARPGPVLVALVVMQIVTTAAVGLSATHDGWAWLQKEDAVGAVRDAWLLGRLDLPETETGHLWLVALAPITWVTGAEHADALPPVVLLQVLVLGPLALLCVYAFADRIAGRLLAYWASLVWIALPLAMIPFADPRFEPVWVDRVLPTMLGLTSSAEYPSMVALLASALFLARSLEARSLTDAALGGILLGAAGGLYLPSLLFGVGAALAYVVARRWHGALAFLGAALAGVAVILLFRERAVGRLPEVSLDVDLGGLGTQMDQFREYLWSDRIVQWAPLAGLVSVLALRRFALAALLGAWLGAFLLAKGSADDVTFADGRFWIVLLPAWPAFVLLVAAIPLLVPTGARRLGDRVRPSAVEPIRGRWVAAAAVLLIVVPAVLVALSSPVGAG